MCYYPLIVADKSIYGQMVKKKRSVPCGQCAKCLENKRKQWFVRLYEEHKKSQNSAFLTLTYEVEPKNGVNKRDVQLWLKRLRKDTGKGVKYYAVGEYGSKSGRAHYHALMFHLPLSTDLGLIVQDTWGYGMIHVGKLTESSINYVCKYHLIPSGDKRHERNREFSLMSKGLGKEYIDRMSKYHSGNTDRAAYQYYEHKLPLPRYYKEKIYTDWERREISERVKCGEFDQTKIQAIRNKLPSEDPILVITQRRRNHNNSFKVKSDKTNKL